MSATNDATTRRETSPRDRTHYLYIAVVVAVLLAATQGFRWIRDLGRRRTLLLGLAAGLITLNWGGYIYGVNSGHVVETALGYFINPLVTVLMGVFILGEQLRPLQWLAMSFAGLAVVVLTLDYGRLPWVALVLAFSFGSYGLAKKSANVDAVESLTLETTLIAPFAAVYLIWLTAHGGSDNDVVLAKYDANGDHLWSQAFGNALWFGAVLLWLLLLVRTWRGDVWRVPLAGDLAARLASR